MREEKAAVFFDKIFNLMFLLCFSVIRWNFGIFLVLFNGGVYTVSIHCAPEMSEIDCIDRIESFWPKFVRGW